MTAALKEWHISAEAIARGDQVIIVRDDRDGEVGDVGTTFWLYPTWEHQTAEGVKRAWHGELARSNRERRADGRVPIRCHCTIEDAWHVADEGVLAALDVAHLRASGTIGAPVTVLLVRASALVEPHLVAPAADGDGAWAELDPAPSPDGLVPALTDDAFALHAARVRGAL